MATLLRPPLRQQIGVPACLAAGEELGELGLGQAVDRHFGLVPFGLVCLDPNPS
jgi:hypothetical protein